jgi:pyruvate/2-oxoglutarate dehydrogenase complex dihydrolipoamide acyltransferase (E2) component
MVDIKMPEAGFNITEGKIVGWYKQVGDRVQAGENVVSVETDKITVDIPAEVAGTLSKIRCGEGEIVPVGGVVGTIAEEGTGKQKQAKPSSQKPEPTAKEAKESQEERRISPAAKALAKQLGVDLLAILSGSGPGGRIVKQDVIDHAAKTKKAPESRPTTGTPLRGRVEFTGWRKVLRDRVVQSYREVPQCTVSSEIDVTVLSQVIASLREKEEGVRVTFLPFMMKAMVQGIRAVPQSNALCDKDGYTLMEEINVGIVVNVEGKLLVPVVRGVQDRSIIDIAKEIGTLVERAKSGTLDSGDITGGTITVTNVGPFGVLQATALLFQPQTTIVYLGAAREVPAVRQGKIEIRKMMGLGVTYDHRVLDGAICGRFLMEVRSYIEDLPAQLVRMK